MTSRMLTLVTALLAAAQLGSSQYTNSTPANGISLDTSSSSSIKNAAATIAYNMMTYYTNNASDTASYDVGTLSSPYYWWEAATVWGALIDYWAYTNDTSYNPTVSQALLAQTGPNNDYMPPQQTKDEGNDDQVFWALACMDALESGFPNPPSGQPQWLELATNVWDVQAARWDNSTCNGGLKWQIFSFNVGYDYKNAASTGGLFLLSARLAHYTGNQTYADWSNKTWDWMSSIGLIDASGAVYDGTDDTTNCTEINHIEWSYDAGLAILGSAALYNMTSSSTWHDRISTLLTHAQSTFFSNSGILTETACEEANPVNCNNDQIAFKGILARYLTKTAILAPFTKNNITDLMLTTATAAARSCSGNGNSSCGEVWTSGYTQDGTYYNAYDGMTGVGEEQSALSAIQSILLLNGFVGASEAQVQTNATSTTSSGGSSNSTTPSTTGSTTSSPLPKTNTADKLTSGTLFGLFVMMACAAYIA